MGNKLKSLRIIGLVIVMAWQFSVQAAGGAHVPFKVHNNLQDKASLQRGAKLYVNFCQGCHSLQFVRYKGMGADLGIADQEGQVYEELVQKNLNFVTDKVTDHMYSAMPKGPAESWFGVAPPDLSLTTRVRGKNWVYSYLKSFYIDESRPWGVNNLVFPDVGMPHVLQTLQGIQVPHYEIVRYDTKDDIYEQKVVDRLELVEKGQLSEKDYDQAITDLVNFLEYVAEPHKLEQRRLGVWVILFLIVFTLFAYLLKREYWKDVH